MTTAVDLTSQTDPIVGAIAASLARRLPSGSFLDVDDLFQVGRIAAISAARSYDPSKENNLATYVGHRIRGAMLDEMRSTDLQTRSRRSEWGNYDDARACLEQRLKRNPSRKEIASELGVTLKELDETLLARAADFTSEIEHHVEPLAWGVRDPESIDSMQPDQALEIEQTLGAVLKSVESLPQNLRFVFLARVDDEASLDDIGNDLGVTKSCICKLVKKAREKIFSYLEPHLEKP